MKDQAPEVLCRNVECALVRAFEVAYMQLWHDFEDVDDDAEWQSQICMIEDHVMQLSSKTLKELRM